MAARPARRQGRRHRQSQSPPATIRPKRYAVIEDFCIRLNVRRRKGVSYFTIGHELTHLLQKPGLGIVPDGEVQCDIWTLARSRIFLDGMPTYLDVDPCRDEDWKFHAGAVRELCIRAIEERTCRRKYIVWLRNMIGEYFTRPAQLDLFKPEVGSLHAESPG